MDLATFRRAVDGCPPGISACQGDLTSLYAYVGLPIGSAITLNAVSEELYRKIRAAFTSGHQAVWRHCRDLETELIQRHIMEGERLDPYCTVLEHMKGAVLAPGGPKDPISGDWDSAIRHAYDHVKQHDWGSAATRERVHAREFEVARAAKRLQDLGYAFSRASGKLALTPDAEAKLLVDLERRISAIGGLNVARRIFKLIAPRYDSEQERYHLVRQAHPTGGGVPQIPFGYLLLLAAKHAFSVKGNHNTDKKWHALLRLVTDYAAVHDVQSYAPNFWMSMDAVALLPYLQEMALYDTLFRVPQTRARDIVKLARGVLDWLNFSQQYGSGWSINDVLAVVDALLTLSRDRRGPITFNARDFRRACPDLPAETLHRVLEDVLCHGPGGANRNFLNPGDAPIRGVPEKEKAGQDFFLRPLLRDRGRSFVLLDRAACTPACLEALLTPLRAAHKAAHKDFDALLGPAIERFLRHEFEARGIPALSGKYQASGGNSDCDLVVETAQTIIFFEVKKKPLTLRARAGSDAHVLVDLANSLLYAQVQAGWHEVRLRSDGFLDLTQDGVRQRLEWRGRHIERVAVSLLDFGSFQDRVMLKQFLEGTLSASFGVNDTTLQEDFAKLNKLLDALRRQTAALHPGQAQMQQPFFHCWFLSVPQVLVLLDGVDGPEALKEALWKTRHVGTGSSDFYFDHAHMKQ